MILVLNFMMKKQSKQFVQYVNTFNITSPPQTNEEINCYKLINNLKTKIETKTKDIGAGSGYVYDGIVILHIHFRKVYLNRGA